MVVMVATRVPDRSSTLLYWGLPTVWLWLCLGHAAAPGPTLGVGSSARYLALIACPPGSLANSHRRQRRRNDVLGRQPGHGHLLRLAVMVDEDVRQDHRPHLQAVVQQALPGEVMQDGAPKPPMEPSSMVISTSWWRASCWTSASSIGLANRASTTVAGSPARPVRRPPSLHRRGEGRATGWRCCCLRAGRGPCRAAGPRRAPAAPRRCLRRAGSGSALGRSSIDDRGGDGVHQFGLIGWRHHHHAGQAAEIGQVEAA